MAITVDNSASFQSNTGSFTVGSQATVLVVLVEQDFGTTVSAVNYNGVGMIQQIVKTDFGAQYIFTLSRPSIGTHNLVISTVGAPTQINVYIISFNEGEPINTIDGNGYCAYPGSGGTATIPITTAINGTVVVDLAYNNSVGGNITAGAGQTVIGSQQTNSSAGKAWASYKQFLTSGSQTTTWTTSSGGIGGISIGIAPDNTLSMNVSDSTTTSESISMARIFPFSGISPDNVATFTSASSGFSNSFIVDPNIINGYLFVATANGGNGAATPSITYNSVSMTLLAQQSNTYFFGLANPSTGSNTLTISSSSNQQYATAASYAGVRQLHQPDSSLTNGYPFNGGGFSAITTVVDAGSWLIGICCDVGSSPSLGGASHVIGAGSMPNINSNIVIVQDSNGPVLSGSQALGWNSNGSNGNGTLETIVLSFAPQNAVSVSESTTLSEFVNLNYVLTPIINDSTVTSELITIFIRDIGHIPTADYVTTSESFTTLIASYIITVNDATTTSEFIKIQLLDQENTIFDSVSTSEFLKINIFKSDLEEIFQYLNGLTDDGQSISSAIETNDNSMSVGFESIVYPVEVMLNIKEGHDIQVFIGLDGAPLIPIGTAKKGLNRIPIDTNPSTDDFARCRLMKIALKEFSKSKVTVANAAVHYYLSAEVEEERN